MCVCVVPDVRVAWADANREGIGGKAGVWSAIVAGLKAHASDAGVQRAGMGLLCNLTTGSGALLWPTPRGGVGRTRQPAVRCHEVVCG